MGFIEQSCSSLDDCYWAPLWAHSFLALTSCQDGRDEATEYIEQEALELEATRSRN
jgi:hypothetical protein